MNNASYINRPLGLLAIVVGAAAFNANYAHAAAYSFEKFAVTPVYKGSTHFPQFKGRDRLFNDMQTRIRGGLKEGPNFAGKFSVIEVGCGAECRGVFIADNKTGQVFNFPRGGEENTGLGLLYDIDSRLMVAQWKDYDADACNIEYFEWTGKEARLLKLEKIGPADACNAEVKDNLK
jgi:hypothetical protein